MAEVLGIVSSIIAIVEISKSIITACHFYIDAVDGASSDLRAILVEVSAVKGIIEGLQALTQRDVTDSAFSNQTVAASGSIDACKVALEQLNTLFPPTAISRNRAKSKRQKLDAAVTALAWPLKRGRAKTLLQEISQHKSTINLTLTAEFLHDMKDLKRKAEQIHVLLTGSERRDVVTWLEKTNPSNIHNRSQRLYEPGTASWILRTPEWPLWIDGKHRCLWIHGIPGAGKSILASYVVTEVEKHCNSLSAQGLAFGHAYYYCYFGHNQDEASHFLRWIISQLCRQSDNIPTMLHDLYKSGKEPSLLALLSILQEAIKAFSRVYVVLDAVDESMPREDLLRVIRDLSTDARFSSLGIFLTSRQYIDIEQVLEVFSMPITMSNAFVEEDIGVLVRSTTLSDAKYHRWPEDFKCALQDTIPKKAKGMFRWAACQLDILKRLKPDASIIRVALSNLPKTLDETYERIFLAIPEEDWLSVQHVFHWIVMHNNLMGTNIPLATLLQAVHESTAHILPNPADQLLDFERLRECCGCLISVDDETIDTSTKGVYYERKTVAFAHYTVEEYLKSTRIYQSKVEFFALRLEKMARHFNKIAVHNALHLHLNFSEDIERHDDLEILSLIDSNFQLYCGLYSVILLYERPKVIAEDSELMDLFEELVNPYRSAYEDLVDWLDRLNDVLNLAESYDIISEFQFWSIDWTGSENSQAAIFLAFLLSTVLCEEPSALAVAFAERHSMPAILTDPLEISKEICQFLDFDSFEYYKIEGTIPEMVAQWAIGQPGTFTFILDIISQYGGENFDLSNILLLYTGCHGITGPHDSSSETLLRLGANVNGPIAAFVTPLQIAVACWDLRGTEILLKAGAVPNSVGEYGLKWPEESPMAAFNHLEGASPLYIIEHFECIYRDDRKDDFGLDESSRQRIKSLLLEYGAVETIIGDFDESDDAESYSEEEEINNRTMNKDRST